MRHQELSGPFASVRGAKDFDFGAENVVSGKDARLRFNFVARHVYLVLGGTGRVQVLVNGKPERVVRVSGLSRLYTLISGTNTRHGILELRFTPGISGYAFTFG